MPHVCLVGDQGNTHAHTAGFLQNRKTHTHSQDMCTVAVQSPPVLCTLCRDHRHTDACSMASPENSHAAALLSPVEHPDRLLPKTGTSPSTYSQKTSQPGATETARGSRYEALGPLHTETPGTLVRGPA
jgi:hypothetical protein